MKTESEVAEVRRKALKMKDASGMTYKEGIEEALDWVLGYLPDDDFTPLESSEDEFLVSSNETVCRGE